MTTVLKVLFELLLIGFAGFAAGQLVNQSNRLMKAATWLAAIGGILGLGIAAYYYFFELLTAEEGKRGWLDMSAFAAEGNKPEMAPFIPYIAISVIILMGLAFIIALCTLLTLKDTKDNQARIKAADNVVKTFGGFFIGLGTALLK